MKLVRIGIDWHKKEEKTSRNTANKKKYTTKPGMVTAFKFVAQSKGV
ncbi:MAG: hypothetical protein WC686_01065 [Candidatus Shapirobacteria bacterium]|jgi:hypothetical protein